MHFILDELILIKKIPHIHKLPRSYPILERKEKKRNVHFGAYAAQLIGLEVGGVSKG